ncbi:MAG: glycoside hydrolase [Planctomycetes bacterium]|nr:glycoside hydrolase [Planctomycetota bacterium]
MMKHILALLISSLLASLASSHAADPPAVVFDAAKSLPTQQGWAERHDRPSGATVRHEKDVLRIEDDDDKGKDQFFHFDLKPEYLATARQTGFTAAWRLRIPNETGTITRAIGVEVCVGKSDGADRLRVTLQMGRRGNELLAGVSTGSGNQVESALAVKDGDAFHDWTMVFDGKSQLLNVFVGDRQLLAARIDHKDTGYPLVFGSRATGTGVSEWRSFQFTLGTGEWKIEPPAPPPSLVDVLVGGKGGYHAYRIPSLVVAPNGDLLVFCEGRKTSLDDDGDIDLLQARSTDGGKTWKPHQLIYEEGGDAKIKYGNPTAVVDAEKGTIWLATNRDHVTIKGARAGGALVLFRSDDSGATWSKPIDITAAVRQSDWGHHAFGPGIGIQIQHGPHRGRLVIPANFRRAFDKSKPSYAHVVVSDDHGKTWKLGGILGEYTNECQVAETREEDKSGLLINMRNHWGRGGMAEKSGKRLVARSTDGGATWSAEKMDPVLTEPPCQASLLRYQFASGDQKSVLLFANPAGGGRKNLTVRMSQDEGRTWPVSKLLVPGSAAYSCMARLPDGRVGAIVETSGYMKLSFIAFDLKWLGGANSP